MEICTIRKQLSRKKISKIKWSKDKNHLFCFFEDNLSPHLLPTQMKEQTRSPKQLAAAVHMNTILPYYGVRVLYHTTMMCKCAL